MIISIFASIGSQNLGDELILKNEINILKKQYSKLKNISENEIFFNIFSYDTKNIFYKEKNLNFIEYFPINIKNPKNIFRNIKNFLNFIKITIKSDLIVIGGGGIFYDNELQSVGGPLKQWLFRINIFKLFRRKIEFFRVGINIKNKKNLIFIKKIFSNSYKISVRDKYSLDLLKQLNIINVQLLKDPVFFDKEKLNNPSIFHTASFNTKKSTLKGKLNVQILNVQNIKNILQQNEFSPLFISGKKIGIALRKQNINNFEEKIIEIIKYFLENKTEIILIPHSFHKTDKKANDYLFLNKIQNTINSNKISICKNLEESYKIYTEKKVDLILASRLHSIILSQVYDLPFIAISYSRKTDEIISQLKNKFIIKLNL